MTARRMSDGASARLPLSKTAAYLFMAAAAAVLGGCDHPRIPDAIHPEFTDHSKRHRPVVAPTTETVDIAVGNGGAAYDQAFMDATRFVRQYKRATGGPLFVSVAADARQSAHLVRSVVSREGIAPERIKWQYAAAPGIVTLSYDRIAAIPPPCGHWQDDVTRNPEMLPYSDWGCSQQHNIAVMAANPTDLAYPAREVPRIGPERPGAPKAPAGGGKSADSAAPAAPAGGSGPGAGPAAN